MIGHSWVDACAGTVQTAASHGSRTACFRHGIVAACSITACSWRETVSVGEYNLDALGWYQFERMCQALLRAVHGAALEAWGGNRDLGRDAYSTQALRFPDPKVATNGPFLFQAKFVRDAAVGRQVTSSRLVDAVRAECTRIKERRASGAWPIDPQYYVLLTNAPLTPGVRATIDSLITAVVPRVTVTLTGRADIAAMLDAQPAIRLAYPQILGLRDLRQLLANAVNADVLQRSVFSLDAAQELAEAFVPTEAYNRALTVLNSRGFAVLLGPPEMGKTATARIICLAKFTSNWEVFECRRPEDLFRVYDRDRAQVFFADDAFGSTEYRPESASEWAAVLDRILDHCDKTHWLLWTTRPGPLREGLRQLHLQGSARHFPSPAEVEVDASHLSFGEKAQMLYRHVKRAKLGPEASALVRSKAHDIVTSAHFTPLRIDRFVVDDLPRILEARPSDRHRLVSGAVEAGLRAPTSAMATSFSKLDEDQRAVLLAMLSETSGPAALHTLATRVESYLGRATRTSVEEIVALLDEHFVRTRPVQGTQWPR